MSKFTLFIPAKDGRYHRFCSAERLFKWLQTGRGEASGCNCRLCVETSLQSDATFCRGREPEAPLRVQCQGGGFRPVPTGADPRELSRARQWATECLTLYVPVIDAPQYHFCNCDCLLGWAERCADMFQGPLRTVARDVYKEGTCGCHACDLLVDSEDDSCCENCPICWPMLEREIEREIEWEAAETEAMEEAIDHWLRQQR